MNKGLLFKQPLLLALLLLGSSILFAAGPASPATTLAISNVEGNSFSLSFKKGDGANHLVILKAGSEVTARPVNGTSYLANASFGQGAEVKPGEFVVYSSSSTSVTVTGLTPGATYHIAVFAYNGSGASSEYLVDSYLAGTASTVSAPTVQASNVSFTNITGSKATMNWEAGNGIGRLVLIKKGSPVDANPADLKTYYATGSFGGGNEIGTGNYVAYRSNGTSQDLTSLTGNTTYHIAVFEFNGWSAPVHQTTNPARGSFTTATWPTDPARDAAVTSPDGNYLNLGWTAGNGASRIVVAREGAPVEGVPVDGTAYSASGSFGEGNALAPGEFIVHNNISSSLRIDKLKAGTTYHFAVFEYNQTPGGPYYLKTNPARASGTTLSAPTTPARDIVISDITNGSMKVSWTNGSGTSRLAVVKKGAPITAVPEQFKRYYTHTAFGSGTSIGDATYPVSSSTANTVTVTNLEPSATYYVTVYEANGSNPVYLTTGAPVGSATTASRPSKPASGLSFASVEGNSMRVDWTAGNGMARMVVARKGAAVSAKPADGVTYTASNTFGEGYELAPGEFVVYNGSSYTFNLYNLEPGAIYHFAVFEYAGTGAATEYLVSPYLSGSQSTKGVPTVPPSGLSFSDILNNSMKLSWSKGDGDRRLIVAKAGGTVDVLPENLKSYSSDADFGEGAQLGAGNYVVYAGTSTSVTINNLQPGVTYHFAVFEYNGSSAPVYLTSSYLQGSQATSGRPTTAASNLKFEAVEPISMDVKWTSGNGSYRIVVAREGSAVTAMPVDNTLYTAGTFGSGDALGAGQYVVCNGPGSSSVVRGLQPGKTYYFTVYEYTQVGGAIAYLANGAPSAGQATLSAPTGQASNVMFSSVGNNAATVSWTNGNGANRLVVVRAGQAVTVVPVDYTKYSVSAEFGKASAAMDADHYAVYAGNGGSVSISGLTSGVTYYVAVFEYNGSASPAYLTTPAGTGSFTTIGAPLTAATAPQVGAYSNGSVFLSWTSGSGQRRLVLAKEGSEVDAVPADNRSYTANSFFGSGEELGTDNFVVYDGTGTGVTVSNLSNAKKYHFAIYEYNQLGTGNVLYLTANAAKAVLLPTVVLPVTWVDFSGAVLSHGVQLTWKTGEEVHNKAFEIERSGSGAGFQKIGTVAPHASSSEIHTYRFRDEQPFEGVNYYRIKQVDEDGQYSYSKVIQVQVGAVQKLRLVQNPVRSQLGLRLSETAAGATLYILDAGGRVVYTGRVAGQQVDIPVPQLRKGMYYVTVQDRNGRKETVPFVKE